MDEPSNTTKISFIKCHLSERVLRSTALGTFQQLNYLLLFPKRFTIKNDSLVIFGTSKKQQNYSTSFRYTVGLGAEYK